MINDLLNKYNIVKKGVIHIGAHKCEELAEYIRIGIKQLIYVEANPEIIDNINKIIDEYKNIINIKLYNVAISDTKELKTFYVTDNIMSSSLFDLKYISKKDGLCIGKTMNVECNTFDNFVQENQIEISNFNILVIDTQGSEYDILNNCDNLHNFDIIQTEVFYQEYYSNGITYDKIIKLLSSKGYKLVHEVIATNKMSGDAYFIKEK